MIILIILLSVLLCTDASTSRGFCDPTPDSKLYPSVDFTQTATINQFQCLEKQGYSLAFVRAYSPAGNGSFDPNSLTNANNAWNSNAAVQIQLYMTPQPKSPKSGATQVTELYNGFTSTGWCTGRIWLQVVEPATWSSSVSSNINFISSALAQIKSYNFGNALAGIYTSKGEWAAITGNWNGASDNSLWYWNVKGGGLSGESLPNRNDFAAFGGWNSSLAKQYGQKETVCGISPVNRDVFAGCLTETFKSNGPVPPKLTSTENKS